MKKILALLMLATLLFAQSANTSNIKSALNNLEDTSRSFLMISVIFEAVLAVAFLGGTGLIYFKKLKGVEKRGIVWLAAAVILGIFGAMCAVGAIIGLIMYLTTPALVNGLVSGG